MSLIEENIFLDKKLDVDCSQGTRQVPFLASNSTSMKQSQKLRWVDFTVGCAEKSTLLTCRLERSRDSSH